VKPIAPLAAPREGHTGLVLESARSRLIQQEGIRRQLRTELFDYTEGAIICEGFVAYDDALEAVRPCVLVVHSWAGQSDAEREKAIQLARLGYVGLALDIYGKGKRGGIREDNSALMQPFMDDRGLLRRRLLAGLAAARGHPCVDSSRIGAMGYCFGGLCVLDLARGAGHDSGLRGVVSIHGIFRPPNLGRQDKITAKVLALHGYDDPLAPPQDLLDFAKEMSAASADWQVHCYGNTVHSFTSPSANDPDRGLMYNADAARRS
jgi:dienelactone hydrolase